MFTLKPGDYVVVTIDNVTDREVAEVQIMTCMCLRQSHVVAKSVGLCSVLCRQMLLRTMCQ